MAGVAAFYGKDDIPGRNTFMPIAAGQTVEEELFCSGTVQFYAQPVGIVVATSFELAERAADLVKLSYSAPSKKGLLSIQAVLDAKDQSRISQKSDFNPTKKGGDVKKTIKGTFYVEGQYHMHMEVQCCVVVPYENDTYDVFAATQWPNVAQAGVATVLGLPLSKYSI